MARSSENRAEILRPHAGIACLECNCKNGGDQIGSSVMKSELRVPPYSEEPQLLAVAFRWKRAEKSRPQENKKPIHHVAAWV
jgi:hypothetical protein